MIERKDSFALRARKKTQKKEKGIAHRWLARPKRLASPPATFVRPSGEDNNLSTEGTREFTDETLPSGATGVTYEITARRSTVRGMPAQFNVNFGIGSGGGIFITSTSMGEVGGGEMKMAA